MIEEIINRASNLSPAVVRTWLVRHAIVSGLIIVAVFWFKPFSMESSLYFWLPFVLGIAVAIHYFAYRAYGITDQYVEERAGALRTRSYDFDHIADITERVDAKHPSVTHKSEQGVDNDISNSSDRSP